MMSISTNFTEAPMAKSFPAGEYKLPPLHPGVVAADALELRVSMREAARAIGMSLTGLNKVLTGESPVTPEDGPRFGVYFGNGPELWMNMQVAYDLYHAAEALKADLKKIKPLAR
jgi:addiction module HigA family antidote